MTDNMKLGVRFGLLLSIVGILLALPSLSASVRIHSTVSGGGFWLYWVQNLIPLVLFALVGGLARRRGFGSASTGLWTGITYGLIAGGAAYVVALLAPDKARLAQSIWNAYLARGYIVQASTHHAVLTPILHPDPLAFIPSTALEMAAVGLVAGFFGGFLVRQTAPGADPNRPV